MNSLFPVIENPIDRIMAETLLDLMEKESIDQLATSRIIEASGVSRSTFYRRYKDKYDLMNQLYQWLLDETIMKVPGGYSFRTAFFSLYETLQTYPEFFKNALSSREPNALRWYIFDKAYEMYEKIMVSEGIDMSLPYYKLLLTGFLNGSLELTCQWAQNGMKEDVEQLYRINFDLMPNVFQRVMSLGYL